MAGDSRYGGNGSIHMKTNIGGNMKLDDKDDKQHADDFDVALLYDTRANGDPKDSPDPGRKNKIAAELRKLASDATRAADAIERGATTAVVKTRVPVVDRPAAPTTEWEITLKW